MRNVPTTVLVLCLLCACRPSTPDASPDAPRPAPEARGAAIAGPPPLPAPLTNNAVASLIDGDRWSVFSFLGLDSTRAWSGVTTASYRWDEGDPAWRAIALPPGPGRLAGTAQAVGGRVVLFGGYTVAEDGSERSVPQVDVLDPADGGWSAAAPMPIPVDDAVSGVWRDSLVFLVSGWHDRDNVADVQIYDPAADAWLAATPIPGPPVFGHAGGVSGDRIVYVGGVRVDRDPRSFVIEPSAWIGRIDPGDPTAIAWSRLPDPPGPPLYRAAAIGLPGRVVFAGGSANPYNYDGIGYDGVPSAPEAGVFAYDVEAEGWISGPDLDPPTMDHRGLVQVGSSLHTVGGMEAEQTVSAAVRRVEPPR